MYDQENSIIDFKKSVRSVTTVSKVLGIWSNSDRFLKLNWYFIYASAILLVCNIHYFVQMSYWFLVPSDLETISASAAVVFEEFSTNFKMYGIIKNQGILKELFENCDQPMFQPKNRKQKIIALATLRKFKLFYYSFATAGTFAVIYYTFFPLVDFSTEKGPYLPFVAWYPFNQTTYFKSIYIHQAIAMFFMAETHVNVDGFSILLMAWVIIQCDLLIDSMRNIMDDAKLKLEREERGDLMKEVDICLQECVVRHKQILHYFHAAYEMLNITVFAQYLASTITICLTLLQTTIVEPTDVKFMVIVVYQMTMLGQLFMYCYWGNEVISKSQELPIAAFESDWLSTCPQYRKNLLIFIHRTQKPLEVFAADYFKVSLPNFMMILRHSYSFYAVIHHMNNNNA